MNILSSTSRNGDVKGEEKEREEDWKRREEEMMMKMG